MVPLQSASGPLLWHPTTPLPAAVPPPIIKNKIRPSSRSLFLSYTTPSPCELLRLVMQGLGIWSWWRQRITLLHCMALDKLLSF